ncbi:SDR family NAD(P)-dependent oxidoreductase [Actinoplanes friuliensis]|jgi:NAD(P)-dependent dehydrogenase (short-subunit alcohol dehydrogenase family)|uniref:Short chain dehydrogenase n=1 Tax=Actinoplanes friuliensis DSM 7358 TaxID=1246995 RepID=U5VXI3_9ACTN|nr:SDR family NAD(P)-dependent oxidoreductase [Actinoplanes friuliensis]AGZ41554.1 short chain dehydrogenase [Actinoplanes friuliensis DSM 7358]
MTKVWFITGTSKGFGREWAEAALDRGDRVAATARDTTQIKDLTARYGEAVLPIELDVTDRTRAFEAVRTAADHFGRLDVVVNNAGYGHFGMVEELSEDDIRAQMETNFFGALWVTQAALPIMRAQRSGHLIQVTSEGGVIAYPGIGAYHASKWALEGLTQSLYQEVGAFGIHVTDLEPGPYATDWLPGGARHSAENPDYQPVRAGLKSDWDLGDPRATRAAILALVDAEKPPLRLLLGKSLAMVTEDYRSRLQTWNDWQDVSVRAFG